MVLWVQSAHQLLAGAQGGELGCWVGALTLHLPECDSEGLASLSLSFFFVSDSQGHCEEEIGGGPPCGVSS